MKIAISTVLIMTILLRYAECSAQNNKLISVKVEFAGFNIETDVDVSCEAFDGTFKETKTKKNFNNSRDLLKFQSITKEFRQLTKKQSFNVRGIIIYSYGKTIDKYCFDTFGCFYKDGKLYYNKALLIYLTDKLFNKHPKYLDTLRHHE
ncbi:MAG: hypothetical protein M3O71_05490 [Bacteroidota bacterium]|nr:hypothetical protein [Bacteroidota bacterium]